MEILLQVGWYVLSLMYAFINYSDIWSTTNAGTRIKKYLGPKKGQKGLFWANEGKTGIYVCEANEIVVVLTPTYLR